MNKTPLPVTHENTMYFVAQRGYHWSRDGQYLTKDNKTIHILNEQYEFSEVDDSGRRLSVKIVTDSEEM